MPTVEKSIEVNAPLPTVYNMWTNFESFPRFMESVKEVRRTGPDQTHWVANVAGQDVEWDATTTVQDKERVAWQSRGESGQSGVVTFDDLGPEKTRINVRIDYKLESGIKETGAKVLGLDDRAVQNDLERFKDMVERGETDVTRERTNR